MDTTTKSHLKKPNPAENANPISTLTFLYMIPIFRRTYKEKLTEDDLFRPLKEHKSSIIGEELENIWKEQFRKHKKYALHFALMRFIGLRYLLYGIIKLTDELILIVIVPLCIGKLVSYFDRTKNTISENEAYMYAGILTLVLVFDTILAHPCMMGLQHVSMKLRIACSSLLYRKTLRLSRISLNQITIGQMVNILSNDAGKFDEGFIIAHFIWIAPISTAVGIYLLYKEIGLAALFGMAFLLSFLPLQVWLGKRISVLRLKTALRTDERVRLMNEILSGIQVIKMYCWEKPFAELIAFARRKEMKYIKKHALLGGVLYSLEIFVTRTSIFLSLFGYVALGNYVTAEKVFAITAIYNQLRPVITILFSISIASIAEVNISLHRFNKILSYSEKLEELEPQNLKMITNGKVNGDTLLTPSKINVKPSIVMENVSAKWFGDSPEDTLKNINLNLRSSQLLAIIGPVGSGKSSLLNVVLKELPIYKGNLHLSGTISFSCQEPWLFSGSVRQNILFGEQFEEERYEKVVDVCALRSDFALFPHGDQTLVGEKGKSLSGGQKARINLARCVYKHADIYLLDDPLSAVDANVGKHLYEKCIKGFLNGKICILVTHQLQYLKSADKIIILNDGNVEMEGSYRELKSSGLDFAKLLEEYQTEDNEETQKKIRSRQNSELESDTEDDEEEQELAKESQATGSIKMSIYWDYFKAGGGKWAITLVVFMFFLTQAVANFGEYFVTYWVNLEQDLTERIQKNLTSSNETLPRDEILYIYSGITLGTIILAVTKSCYYMLFLTYSSVNLHNFIFSRIIKATMTFYNNNPSGRILNRFSKDLGTMDEYLPHVLVDVAEIFLLLAGTLILSSIVDPWLLLPSVFLCALFYLFRKLYIETSRSVKRVESITRSPIYGHMTASINGLSTIRALKAEKLLISEFDDLQDRHSSAWFMFLSASRCFGFWLDMTCITFITICTFTLLVFNDEFYGGSMGLVLTQCITLIGSLQWGMRQWSELENQMTSVERILEYTRLDSEPERKHADNLPKDWPANGKIEFQNVSLKYNENDPYVLKSLNFTVQSKEKVGIVGRTGAGKSSTISALFQLYNMEGSILLDEVDSTKIPLDQVRNKISIIPQEPVLFSGTMRKNLDPFEEYSDEVLWNALEQVELKDAISELPAGLNSNVTEGGTNFSVGQRQLVCLARALIRNNKILVLDEATANVDPHTDALIQQTIRNKFADCTVLTIAHRLHTVMDSDKILVMSAGSLEEFDHPYVLLQNKLGILNSLVEATGTNTSKTLENVAKENYLKKKTN